MTPRSETGTLPGDWNEKENPGPNEWKGERGRRVGGAVLLQASRDYV